MLTVIMPAYNEAERIAAVLYKAMPSAQEVLVVDDGSLDQTVEVARFAGARVTTQENQGYLAAVKRGFQEARGDIVLTMDADGEHDPLDIPDLVRPIEAWTADMVLGRREHIARISERIISRMAGWKVQVNDTGTGMRAMRRSLAVQLSLPGRCICGTSVLEARHLGARIVEVPIHLGHTAKPRRWAWGHMVQIWYVLLWLLKA